MALSSSEVHQKMQEVYSLLQRYVTSNPFFKGKKEVFKEEDLDCFRRALDLLQAKLAGPPDNLDEIRNDYRLAGIDAEKRSRCFSFFYSPLWLDAQKRMKTYASSPRTIFIKQFFIILACFLLIPLPFLFLAATHKTGKGNPLRLALLNQTDFLIEDIRVIHAELKTSESKLWRELAHNQKRLILLERSRDLFPTGKKYLIDKLVGFCIKNKDWDQIKVMLEPTFNNSTNAELIRFFCNLVFTQGVYHAELNELNTRLAFLIDKPLDRVNALAFNIPTATTGSKHPTKEQKLKILIERLIAQDGFSIFMGAVNNNRIDIIEYLLTHIAPEQQQAIIAANDYDVFRKLIYRHHHILSSNISFAMAARLLDLVPLPVQLQRIQPLFADENFRLFREVARCFPTSSSLLERLLLLPEVLDYAEKHVEFNTIMAPFFADSLQILRARCQAWAPSSPGEVFNLTDPAEIERCFYHLRSYIRQNQIEEIRFFLSIPSVRAIAFTHGNELLHLASGLGDENARQLLLTIPEVAQLEEVYLAARGRNHPAAEPQTPLQDMARNTESSMVALSAAEEQCLFQLKAHYEPLIKAVDINSVLDHLRIKLLERYDAHPATIKRDDGRSLALPVSWEAFQALRLPQAEYKRALEAYYQHKDHTAWRWLLKPNPWLGDAFFVVSDQGNRWSNFENHRDLIALFYLGATDEDPSMAPTDGQSVEAQLTHFIDELAHIERAHNWDKTRQREVEGRIVEEQYDDLKGDSPSCRGGTTRRLFQSLPWHPLMRGILTSELLQQEINMFLNEHFRTAVAASQDRTALKAVWEKAQSDALDEREITLLKQLDIPTEKQATFSTYLSEKYGGSFKSNSKFIKDANAVFILDGENDSHAVNFGGEMLTRLLANSPSPRTDSPRAAFFQEAAAASSAASASSPPRQSSQ